MNGNPLGASICTRSFGEPKEHLRSRPNSLDSLRNRHLAGYGDLKNEFRVAEFVINLEGSSRRVSVATIFGICVRDHSTATTASPTRCLLTGMNTRSLSSSKNARCAQ